MPRGYDIIDSRNVRGPDGREHDVLDAIRALEWKPQYCPLMRHEYTIRNQNLLWAWNVLDSMLLKRNPDSFSAYFRNYQTPNRYWDAPDGLRYWRGNRMEIDRGAPDGVGLRRVKDGAKPSKSWDGPRFAPAGIGLYGRNEKGKWRPTDQAIAAGFLPCRSCEQTIKSPMLTPPKDPDRVAAFIADAASGRRRPLTRDELAEVLKEFPVDKEAASPGS